MVERSRLEGKHWDIDSFAYNINFTYIPVIISVEITVLGANFKILQKYILFFFPIKMIGSDRQGITSTPSW